MIEEHRNPRHRIGEADDEDPVRVSPRAAGIVSMPRDKPPLKPPRGRAFEGAMLDLEGEMLEGREAAPDPLIPSAVGIVAPKEHAELTGWNVDEPRPGREGPAEHSVEENPGIFESADMVEHSLDLRLLVVGELVEG
jgi:hypothetical protein